MFVHALQIIPIFLYLSHFTRGSLFDLGSAVSTTYLLMASSLLAFFFSLKMDRAIFRGLFVFFLSLVGLLVLNSLYKNPSLGTFLCAIYTITVFHFLFSATKNRKTYSAIVSYTIAMVFFLSLRFGFYQDLQLGYFSILLSFASFIFLWLCRHGVPNSYGALASLAVPASSVYFILNRDYELASILTNIWMFAVTGFLGYGILLHGDSGLRLSRKILSRFPEGMLFAYFLALSAVGAILLELPLSRAGDTPFLFLDSIFTAVSAVCVTGLIVLDTPVDFSFFGQAVILSLIQLGGFGIVALSSWVLLGFKSARMSLEQELLLKEMGGYRPSLFGMQSTLRRILMYFLVNEVLGALFLFFRFMQYDDHIGVAMWRAVFTAISAFCNAGFALQSDSLIPYQHDPIILITVSFLIIAGGFAPLMIMDLPFKILKKKLSLQEKLVLSSTAGLLFLGFFYFIIAEWNVSLAGLGVFDKLTNAWFQSVTTRTAGFNSVDLTAMSPLSPFFFLLLMFVGGNPGGTAGGIKTVTFSVLFLSALAGIRGEDSIRVFNRYISQKSVFRTFAIFSVAFTSVSIGFFMLSTTQTAPITSLLFETVSAIGTVGLSIGATASLDEVGKVIIMLCMLMGRVGPLAFILLLFRSQARAKWKVSEENIFIS